MVTIKDYYEDQKRQKDEASSALKSVCEEIEELEKNEIVQAYIAKIKKLDVIYEKMSFGNTFLGHYDESEFQSKCEHPFYMYDYDIVTKNDVDPAIRCLVCNKWFFNIKDVNLDYLFDKKRLVAKKCSKHYDENGYTAVKEKFDDIKKAYYELYITFKNEEGMAEDFIFDRYSKGSKVRKRK